MKPKARILIVEDEEFMATHIKRTLLRAGYDVSSVVESGERAVQAVSEDLPDVVLMDITLADEMDGIDPAGYTILLSHAPDIVFHLDPYEVDLVLSGHTHGGQVNLPLFGTVIKRTKLKRKQCSGLFKYNGSSVHITQGLGASPKAMIRFLCTPEMAVLTLRKKVKDWEN